MLSLGGAAALVATAGCAPSGPRAPRPKKVPLSEQITVKGFSVSGSRLANSWSGSTRDSIAYIGQSRLEDDLQTALNDELRGFGTGPKSVVLRVNLRAFVVTDSLWANSVIASDIFAGNLDSGLLSGRLTATVTLQRGSAGPQAEYRKLITEYVDEMKQLLERS